MGPTISMSRWRCSRPRGAAGTSTVVATPHLRADFPGSTCSSSRSGARSCGPRPRAWRPRSSVVGGAEISLGWALAATDEELALASYGQRGSDLLIETPFATMPPIEPILGELRSRGYRVVLAHPERSADFQRDRERVRGLVEEGALLQVNAGRWSPRARGRGPASWAGGSAERGSRTRSPLTGIARRAGARWGCSPRASPRSPELVGDARARWMAEAVPGAIVEGRELPPGSATGYRRRRRAE